MVLTKFELLSAGIGAIFAVLAIVVTMLRWIYQQGGANREQVIATRQNTEATKTLSSTLGDFTNKTDSVVGDHEKRITRLEAHEDTRGSQVSHSSFRQSGQP